MTNLDRCQSCLLKPKIPPPQLTEIIWPHECETDEKQTDDTQRGEGVTSKKLTTKNNMTMTNITGSSSCVLYHQAVSRHASKVWKLIHRVKLTVSTRTSLEGFNCLVSGWERLKNVPWSHKGKKLWHAGKQRSTQQMIRAEQSLCVYVWVCVFVNNWKPRSLAIYLVLSIVISFHISFSFWFLS